MSQSPEDREGQIWLERGINSARAGRRAEARQALFRALNYESQREMSWLWLAAVSDDIRQERVYLEKVLSLNQDNPYAKAGLDQLEKRLTEGGGSKMADVLSGATAKPSAKNEDDTNADALGQTLTASAPMTLIQRTGPIPKQTRPAPVVQNERPAAASVPLPPKPVKADRVEPARPKPAPVPQAAPARMPIGPTEEIPVATSLAAVAEKKIGAAVEEIEPSGWTLQSRPVAGSRKQEVEEPSGWTRATPRVPRSAEPPRQMRYEPVLSSPAAVQGNGGLALMVNEVFANHETWTVMAASASLGFLALILIVLAVVSLI